MKPLDSKKEYQNYVNKNSPNSPIIKNCFNLAHKNTIIILDDVIFKPEWVQEYTVGPTKTWLENLNEKFV